MAPQRTERDFHRRVGTACFNRAWTYLERTRLGAEDRAQLLDLVHSSRYHWGIVGTPRNAAIADWQVSRAYAKLGEGDLAEEYARATLRRCETAGLVDLLPSAHEAMARALAVRGETARARRQLQRARALLAMAPVDAEGRAIFTEQIDETDRLVERRRRRA